MLEYWYWRKAVGWPLEKLIFHVVRSALFLILLHCRYIICLLFNLFLSRYGTTIWYCVPLLGGAGGSLSITVVGVVFGERRVSYKKQDRAYTSREPEFTPVYFCWGRTAHLFSLFVSSYYLSYDFCVVIWVKGHKLPMTSYLIYDTKYQRANKNRQLNESSSIWYRRRGQTNQKRNTTCVGHHYEQANSNNVNKTWAPPTNNWR
jgi:hypothetical protein